LPDETNLEGAADVILIAAENLRQLLVSLPRRTAAVAQKKQVPPNRRGQNSGNA
jgi:hypothetical protein